MHTRRRQVAALAIIVAVGMAAAACERDQPASTSSSTVGTTSSTAAPLPPPLLGTAVGAAVLGADAEYARAVASRFDIVTPENEMKWGIVHPAPGVYDFGPADRIVAFAGRHGLRVRGHNLAWHFQNPAWLTDGTFTRAELKRILHRHITTVVGHYRGRVAQWDVVNEAIDDSAGLRRTLWLDGIGPEYSDLAFDWAHAADPDARLFYNDYGGEGLGPKSDAIYDLVAGMVGRGVPIDGVGLQMHTTAEPAPGGSAPASPMLFRPDPDDLAANMRRLGALGLEVAVTEMDVRLPLPSTPDAWRRQAAVYRDVATACHGEPACRTFVTWGFTDRYSWIPSFMPGFGDGLPLDAALRPKPAWRALRAALGVG